LKLIVSIPGGKLLFSITMHYVYVLLQWFGHGLRFFTCCVNSRYVKKRSTIATSFRIGLNDNKLKLYTLQKHPNTDAQIQFSISQLVLNHYLHFFTLNLYRNPPVYTTF